AGVFYKNFDAPIEQMLDDKTFNFRNAKNAKSYGVEVEFRKKLDVIPVLKNFTFQANGAYIYSMVKDTARKLDRPMQGQSPYVVNIGLLYDLEKHGISATLLYNQIGRRVFVVGNAQGSGALGGAPDVYERPRPLLDFQVGKKVLKNKAEIRLNISDILNQKQYFYQNLYDNNTQLQKNQDAYRFTRRYGTTFSISFNYSL
ncbi:MAG: TonB-dependent receptor, partial [Sphingobacteriales bacterium]|nr:TonB-dependent receptor [Sphingobacteriales bacterium]